MKLPIKPVRPINLAVFQRCELHARQGETFCIDCGLVLCAHCCSYDGRCMGCNTKAMLRERRQGPNGAA